MWERPEGLWRRLKLGREEYLQRLLTTLIVGGDPPPWNTPRRPSAQGGRFLDLLDRLAHGGVAGVPSPGDPGTFIDEYLLPKRESSADNGWPDWAVLWPGRVWIIELKTESGSHRADQLPYYLLLAAAAHPWAQLDLTYITGPLHKPPPTLLKGQRYSHLTWREVLPLVETVWGDEARPEVTAYVEMVRSMVENLEVLRPGEHRQIVIGPAPEAVLITTDSQAPGDARPSGPRSAAPALSADPLAGDAGLLALARATAGDGRQRGVGATDPEDLETLRNAALEQISALRTSDPTRFVLPWLWKSGSTGGRALTVEGDEYGYELRFSLYRTTQVTAEH